MKLNMKGIVIGVIFMIFVIGGFIIIPNLMSEKTNPIDYVYVQRDEIPEKILDVMDKYVDQERALAIKLEGKIYVVVTKGDDNDKGIEMDKITTLEQDDKKVMRVDITYKEKEESHPYIVVETNLEELPDKIEVNISK